MWVVWLCSAVATLTSVLLVILLRPVSPVATESTATAPAAASVAPAPVTPEPVLSRPVGKTEVIVAHEESLGELAVRGGKVYYVDYPELGMDDGHIKVASVDRTLQRGKVHLRGAMSGIMTDGRTMCFYEEDTISCDRGDLGRFDAHGIPTDVVVRNDAVYWTTFGDGDGALWERRKGKDRQLVGGLDGSSRLAMNRGGVYIAMCRGNSFDDCVIESFDIEGGRRHTYEVSRGDVRAIAVDEHDVYWIDARRGEIRGMNAAVAQPWTVASNLKDPRKIAIDKNRVYWTDYTAGTVSRASKSGGDVVLLAAGQKGPIEITLDETHVYWGNLDDGTIRRTEKLPVE